MKYRGGDGTSKIVECWAKGVKLRRDNWVQRGDQIQKRCLWLSTKRSRVTKVSWMAGTEVAVPVDGRNASYSTWNEKANKAYCARCKYLLLWWNAITVFNCTIHRYDTAQRAVQVTGWQSEWCFLPKDSHVCCILRLIRMLTCCRRESERCFSCGACLGSLVGRSPWKGRSAAPFHWPSSCGPSSLSP